MKRRIDGGRLLDITDGSLTEASILVDEANGKILALGTELPEADETIRLSGEVLVPGMIDVHVHLREPGFEEKETIATGTRAAAAGGFTQIACMPNTKPVLDREEFVRHVIERAEDAANVVLHPIACITRGQQGEELTDFASLRDAGAIALSDDGRGVQNGSLMREAMWRAAQLELPIAIHAEDESLAGTGVLHTDAAKRLKLSEIPPEAEAAMIARDLLIAEQTGAHLHVCHVSTESAVSLIAWGKSRGIRVTAEVTPHHLLLTDDLISIDDATYKVNPPLRSERDRLACLRGFLDGTLDMIATDHAPHTDEEKRAGIARAPFGMVGIETVFPLLYTYLVVPGYMTLPELVKRMSTSPAKAFRLRGGVIRAGGAADFAAVDLATERKIDPMQFYSKGHNTPFAGWHAAGFATLTVCRGRVTHDERTGL